MSQNVFFIFYFLEGELYVDGQPWPCWGARPTSNKRLRPRSEAAEMMALPLKAPVGTEYAKRG